MHRRKKYSDLESKNVLKGRKNDKGDEFSARCKELFMNSVKRIEMERLHRKLGAGRVTITEIFDEPSQNSESKTPANVSTTSKETHKLKAIDPNHSVSNNDKNIRGDRLCLDDSESEVDGAEDYQKWNFSTDGSDLGNSLYFKELQKIILRKDQFKEIYNMLCSSDEDDNSQFQ